MEKNTIHLSCVENNDNFQYIHIPTVKLYDGSSSAVPK